MVIKRLEQKFWNNSVRPLLKSIQGLRYERIELKTGVPGVPDIYYSYHGGGWIELKATETRDLNPDYIDLRGWTVDQREWAVNHIESGAIVWLMIKVNQRVAMIYPPQCNTENTIKWDHPAVRLVFDHPAKDAGREALKKLLRSQVEQLNA